MAKKLTPQEAAILRMAMQDESASLRRDMANTSDAYRSEYPRMMYRPTDTEDVFVMTTHDDGRPRETQVLNRFDGLLCEITVAIDADHAERLAGEGWDVSPRAAHGVTAGLGTVVSAKDARIAELEAMIAAQEAPQADVPRRGRPPRVAEEV